MSQIWIPLSCSHHFFAWTIVVAFQSVSFLLNSSNYDLVSTRQRPWPPKVEITSQMPLYKLFKGLPPYPVMWCRYSHDLSLLAAPLIPSPAPSFCSFCCNSLSRLLYFQRAEPLLPQVLCTSVLSTWNILLPVIPQVSASNPLRFYSNITSPKGTFSNWSPYMKQHTLPLCQYCFIFPLILYHRLIYYKYCY